MLIVPPKFEVGFFLAEKGMPFFRMKLLNVPFFVALCNHATPYRNSFCKPKDIYVSCFHMENDRGKIGLVFQLIITHFVNREVYMLV